MFAILSYVRFRQRPALWALGQALLLESQGFSNLNRLGAVHPSGGLYRFQARWCNHVLQHVHLFRGAPRPRQSGKESDRGPIEGLVHRAVHRRARSTAPDNGRVLNVCFRPAQLRLRAAIWSATATVAPVQQLQLRVAQGAWCYRLRWSISSLCCPP